MMIASFMLIGFLSAVAMTGIVYRYALSRQLLDVPNERSSHSRPTPRGGGLAIVVTVTAITTWLGIIQQMSLATCTVLIVGGLFVATAGWWDDRYSLSPLIRASVHLLAAVIALYGLGPLHQLDLGTITLTLDDWGGTGLTLLGIVWLINLYNFMDGTDGLAAMQGVCSGLMGGLLFLQQQQSGLALLSLVLAMASAGFLYWNWPPARIFMGDVGSGYLGYALAVLILAGQNEAQLPLLLWLILLALFIGDATFTLVHRLLLGQPWYQAHRQHAYQRLTQLGWSHRRVMLGLLGTHVCVLAPVTWYFSHHPAGLGVGVLALFIVLGLVWYYIQHAYALSGDLT